MLAPQIAIRHQQHLHLQFSCSWLNPIPYHPSKNRLQSTYHSDYSITKRELLKNCSKSDINAWKKKSGGRPTARVYAFFSAKLIYNCSWVSAKWFLRFKKWVWRVRKKVCRAPTRFLVAWALYAAWFGLAGMLGKTLQSGRGRYAQKPEAARLYAPSKLYTFRGAWKDQTYSSTMGGG